MLFWVVAVIAFYGLARLGELLLNHKTDEEKVPVLKALRFEKAKFATFATIQLTKTKNHKSAVRATLIINPTNDHLCPIKYSRHIPYDVLVLHTHQVATFYS